MMRSQEFHSIFLFHIHISEIMAELSFDIDSYVLSRTQLRQKKKGLLNGLGNWACGESKEDGRK